MYLHARVPQLWGGGGGGRRVRPAPSLPEPPSSAVINYAAGRVGPPPLCALVWSPVPVRTRPVSGAGRRIINRT